MGVVHAAAWRSLGVELTGVVARTWQSTQEFAVQQGITAFESYEQLLEEVDLVDLCLPTDLHRQFTEQAAAAGRHVICEKPVALGIEDGLAMIAACDRAGVRLFIAQVVRFFPQYRAARELLNDGALGDLGVLTLKRVSTAPFGGGGWFADEARSGGLLFDLMVHDLDYARWLGGPVERVFARSLLGQDAAAAADYAQVTLRFRSGALALLEGGWVLPPAAFRTAFDIAGSDGLIEWSSDTGEPVRDFLHPHGERVVQRVGLPSLAFARDPYELQLEHALQAIVNDGPFEVTAREALEAVSLALAARESLCTGQPAVPAVLP
jgi:predicted dehydrogenase